MSAREEVILWDLLEFLTFHASTAPCLDLASYHPSIRNLRFVFLQTAMHHVYFDKATGLPHAFTRGELTYHDRHQILERIDRNTRELSREWLLKSGPTRCGVVYEVMGRLAHLQALWWVELGGRDADDARRWTNILYKVDPYLTPAPLHPDRGAPMQPLLSRGRNFLAMQHSLPPSAVHDLLYYRWAVLVSVELTLHCYGFGSDLAQAFSKECPRFRLIFRAWTVLCEDRFAGVVSAFPLRQLLCPQFSLVGAVNSMAYLVGAFSGGESLERLKRELPARGTPTGGTYRGKLKSARYEFAHFSLPDQALRPLFPSVQKTVAGCLARLHQEIRR